MNHLQMNTQPNKAGMFQNVDCVIFCLVRSIKLSIKNIECNIPKEEKIKIS